MSCSFSRVLHVVRVGLRRGVGQKIMDITLQLMINVAPTPSRNSCCAAIGVARDRLAGVIDPRQRDVILLNILSTVCLCPGTDSAMQLCHDQHTAAWRNATPTDRRSTSYVFIFYFLFLRTLVKTPLNTSSPNRMYA